MSSLPDLPFEIPGLAQLARQFSFANGRDLRAALESADACGAHVHCGDLLQVHFAIYGLAFASEFQQEETIAAVKAALGTSLKGVCSVK